MDPASDETRSPRSSSLTDLAGAREAAAARAAHHPEVPQQRSDGSGESMSMGVLTIALLVGTVIFLVGVATSSLIGAIAATMGLGVAVAALVMLFRRAQTTGRLGLGVASGVLMLVVGLMLGMQSYDERFFGDRANRDFWDAVSWVGALVALGGLLVVAVSLLGLLVVAVVRLFRSG